MDTYTSDTPAKNGNERSAINIAAAFIYAVLTALFFTQNLLHPLTRSRDLPSFYYGSALAISGQADPYSKISFAKASRRTRIEIFPFVYPPTSVPLLSPLHLGSLKHAQRRLVAVNLFAGLAAAWLLIKTFLRLEFRDPRAIAIAALIFVGFPTQLTIAYGQVNILVLLLVLLGGAAVVRGRHETLGGAAFGAAAALKLYPGFLVIYLALQKRWRALFGALATIGVLSGLASALCHPGIWRQWLQFLSKGGFGWHPESLFSPAKDSNQSLQGLIARAMEALGLYDSSAPFNPILSFLGSAAAMIILGATALWWLRRPRPAKEDVGAPVLQDVAVGLTALFLAAPFSWDHHLVFLIPGIAVILARGTNSWLRGVALIFVGIICAARLPRWCLASSLITLAVLMLWIMLLGADEHDRSA